MSTIFVGRKTPFRSKGSDLLTSRPSLPQVAWTLCESQRRPLDVWGSAHAPTGMALRQDTLRHRVGVKRGRFVAVDAYVRYLS